MSVSVAVGRYQGGAGKKAVLVGLIDSVENRLTLKYSNGTFYRITLSVITYSELIECCLVALKQCLPRDAALVLACRWYSARHVIGSEDLDTTQEWDIFTSILFELLGYEDDQICDKPEIPAVKRQKTSPSSAVEDWSNLLSSDIEVRDIICEMFNLQVSPIVDKPPSSNTSKISVNPKGILFPHLRNIHFTLHLLYEDFKLNNLYGQCVLPLAKLLSQISINLGLRDYTLHYWKDFPKYVAVKGPKIDEALFKCFNVWQGISEKPVSVMAHIYKLLKGHNLLPYPHFMNVNGRSRDIVQLCGVLSQSNRDGSSEILLDSFIRELAQPMQDSSHVKHQKSNTVDCSLNEQVALLMVDMKIDTKQKEPIWVDHRTSRPDYSDVTRHISMEASNSVGLKINTKKPQYMTNLVMIEVIKIGAASIEQVSSYKYLCHEISIGRDNQIRHPNILMKKSFRPVHVACAYERG
ncbi:hypothetical protein YQE_02931, partial [Dendroctonus ponderosae]